MSSYYPSFNYLGINSIEKNLVVAHFDSDSGEMDTYLGMEPIYTESSDGTTRLDYGAKFNNVATIKLSVIKQDGADFYVSEVRDCLKWLTGSRKNSALDLSENFIDEFTGSGTRHGFALKKSCDHVNYVILNGVNLENNEWSYRASDNSIQLNTAPEKNTKLSVSYSKTKYSFIGRVTNAWQQKMDARTIGIVIEFTSVSPWAYSPIQTEKYSVSGSKNITIDCQSDDLYSYVHPNIKYTNTSGSSLKITNNTTGDITEISSGLKKNEIITISDNMMIVSDNSSKKFGTSFNFVFPRFAPGINELVVDGTGTIIFEYITPLKVGDCAMDIVTMSNAIWNEHGEITLDTLPWSRITNTPTTLSGYGISDAYDISSVYNKTEIDGKIKTVSDNVKSVETLISNVSSNFDNYYKKTEVYTKTEVDGKVSTLSKSIQNNANTIQTVSDEAVSAANLASNLSSNLSSNYYTKTEVNNMISNLEIDATVGINEDELNNMLIEILI